MLGKHFYFSLGITAEEIECTVDLIVQELPCDYNAFHRIVLIPRLSSKYNAMGCAAALETAKVGLEV